MNRRKFIKPVSMTWAAFALLPGRFHALAVGLAVRCKPCIYLHVQKALKAGASREQILEAAEVVVMMAGGPAYTHVPEVIKALDELGS